MYKGIEEFEFMFLVIWEKWIYPVPTIHYTGIKHPWAIFCIAHLVGQYVLFYRIYCVG